MAPVQLIQGGTCTRVVKKLKQSIADAEVANARVYDCFYLFPDHENCYDARSFGYIKTKDVRKFSTHEALSKCRIVPVPIHNITEEHSWTYEHVLAMWTVSGYIKRQLESGIVVVLACTDGKNRSAALQYAVDPTGEYSAMNPEELKARVKCPLMRRWVEAFHKSPGAVPEGLAPLVANARAANPFDETGRVSSFIKLENVKCADLKMRILARVDRSVTKTIVK